MPFTAYLAVLISAISVHDEPFHCSTASVVLGVDPWLPFSGHRALALLAVSILDLVSSVPNSICISVSVGAVLGGIPYGGLTGGSAKWTEYGTW